MDFLSVFERLCSLNLSLLHSANNRRFFTDPDEFTSTQDKYPLVLCLELPKRVLDGKSDNIFLVEQFELWFLKDVPGNDVAIGRVAQAEMMIIACDFVSGLKKQASFEPWLSGIDRIPYFNPGDCSFEKVSNLGLMGDNNWGVALRVTLGAGKQFAFDNSKWY